MTLRDDAQPGVVGSVLAVEGRGIVRMEDHFNTDAEDLWSTLTNPDRLARWVARVHGELRVGGTFEASFTSGWVGPGRIDVCQPPRRLVVSCRPGEDDETVIEAQIVPDGARCRLVVEERGLPLAEAHLHGAGWQAHIEDLGAYLADQPARDWRARWTELAPSYPALG
ncbi:MAG TPA: SRPBCC family protein [Pseudonocardiaceae bacterium]|nr:SRPBCC family protein [Pseudonocardiaceae bacterium]